MVRSGQRGTSWLYYVKPRAPAVTYTMFAAELGAGNGGTGGFGCAPGAPDPNADYSGWCANEADALPRAEQQLLATEFAGCSLIDTVLSHEYAEQGLNAFWLHDLPVGLIVGAGSHQTSYYIQPNALGTLRVIIDPDRDVAVWRWEMQGEAFGDDAPNQDPDNDGIAFVFDLRFPGQRYDSATGMNYNYYRDYEAGTGRYLQSDPLGLFADISTYGYVKANSLRWTDRYGLEVDINLFNSGSFFGLVGRDIIFDRAQNVQNRPGEISIGGPGYPGAIVDQNGKPIPIDRLADMIRATDKWKNGVRNVRLYVCNSGKKDLPYLLANELGPDVVIYGASENVQCSPTGTKPRIYRSRDANGNIVKPGVWSWTTSQNGWSGICENGCY